MKIVIAPTVYFPQATDICIFLAGGITNCPDWQGEVIKHIKDDIVTTLKQEMTYMVLVNPRHEKFNAEDKSATRNQIGWEFKWLERADILSILYSDSESVQPIALYELGRNIVRMQMKFPADWRDRIIISVDENYKRKEDVIVQTELATNGLVPVHVKPTDELYTNHAAMIRRSYFSVYYRHVQFSHKYFGKEKK